MIAGDADLKLLVKKIKENSNSCLPRKGFQESLSLDLIEDQIRKNEKMKTC